MNLYNDVYQLLSENDCVIIPGFGGFVANYSGAQVDLNSQEFNPPCRRIAFNQSLNSNDGLLINHIAGSRSLAWNAATSYVADFVNEINSSLSNGQSVVFDKLGKFTRNSDSLVFTPFENNALLDEAYGLTSFNFPMLQNAAKARETQKAPVLSKTKEAKTNRPKRSLKPLVIGLTAAAAITGLITVSIHFGWFTQDNKNNGFANVVPVENITKPAENKEKVKTVEPVKVEKETVKVEKETVAKKAEPVVKEQPIVKVNTSLKSHIIAGSFSAMENAEILKNQLIASGFDSHIMTAPNGMYRVAVKSYSDSSQASAELSSLRDQTGNQSLWVLND